MLITIKFKADQCFDSEEEANSALEAVSDKTREAASKTNEAVSKAKTTINEAAFKTRGAGEVEAEEALATTDGTTDGTNKSTENPRSKSRPIGTKSKLLNSLLFKKMLQNTFHQLKIFFLAVR